MTKSIAQYGSIVGEVRDSETGQQVEFAHVFIGNTTHGITSDEHGNFKLENVPAGEFDLVASFVGYDLYVKRFHIEANQTITAVIKLIPKMVKLDEVKVTGKQDRNWKRQLKKFTREFLGNDSFARRCTVLNPWVVNFDKDHETGMNIASANDPIEVINEALGYKIFFYLQHFMWQSGYISYFGYPRFEILKADTEQEKKEWKTNRNLAYEGSLRHLFFAIVNDRVQEEGFKIYQQNTRSEEHSTNYLMSADLKNMVGNQLLEFEPERVISRKIGSDNVQINFYGTLVVDYKKVRRENSPYQVSAIKFFRPVRSTTHGYVFDQLNYEVSGYYMLVRLSNLLPFEYGINR